MNDGLMYSAAAIHTFGIPLGWRTPEEPFFFSRHNLFYFFIFPELLFGKSGFFLE